MFKKIKERRLHKNYKQEYLARTLRITQHAYSKLELGEVELTIDKLFIKLGNFTALFKSILYLLQELCK